MTTWTELTERAPRITTIFTRRHAATGHLCMLATLRKDGFPRISPIEPKVFEGQLLLIGMPHTTKFHDLARDPRFCLHTATVAVDGTIPCFMLVAKDAPYRSVKEFVAYARTNKDKMQFASAGVGSAVHLACFQFTAAIGATATPPPVSGRRRAA